MTQNTLEDAEYLSMTMEKTDMTSTVDQNTETSTIAKDSKAKSAIKQIVGIGLAGAMLWFCFKDADLNKLWQYAKEADMTFMIATCANSIFSHVIRAWRWTILLQPLSEKKISLWNSFCAVMYGYAVNVAIPRGGEVARLVSISKTEHISWAGVLPTMFIDRLLDLAMLVLLMGVTLSKLPPGILDPRLTGPLGIFMCVATFAGLFALPFVGKIGRFVLDLPFLNSKIPAGLRSKLDALLAQFDAGTRSLTSLPKLLVIALSSIAIWACYWLNGYLMIFAFHLDKLVDIAKTLVIFTISSVSVLVPTPGSAGSYHILSSQTLQKVAGVDPAQALAYATVTHLICFVIVACLPAGICFIIQNAQNSSKAAE